MKNLQVKCVSIGLVLGVVAAAGAPLPEAPDPVPDPAVQEIAEASIAASGGEALQAIRSLRRRGTLRLDSDLFGTLEGEWSIACRPGERGWQKADFGEPIGWDGATGWEVTELGVRRLSADEIALNRWLWEPNLLWALARDGRLGAVARLADESIGDRLQHVLVHTAENGTQTRIYVDTETSLVSRLESSLELPMLGRVPAITDWTDYREVGGLQLPGASSQIIEGLWTYEATFHETELDPDLPESLFEPPSS